MRNYFYKIFLLILPLFLIIFSFTFQKSVYAASENNNLPVVTVINPIRGNEWHDKINLLLSLKEQWKAIQNEKVNATWLWQYTALEDENLVNFAKKDMKNQEFGLFLEIDRNTAKKANVQYRGQGPLYFSDGLFLVSYDKEERKKLIDEIFAKFKKTFGYYPKTVGAWWIGGDSLTYMQKKYGIVAAMKAADQFDLDVYSIWGSPWSIPYIASTENEGIPASSFDDGSKVVIIQWAPRDPLNGYADARFSLQDFSIQGYPFSYTDYISSIYLKNPLGNLNVGLENGGTSAIFEGYYSDKLSGAKNLEKEKKAKILLVKDYAEMFLSRKKIFTNSDTNYFLSKDYKSSDQSFWYHSSNFKAGIHKIKDSIYLIDLHDYSSKVNEDFSMLPNSQGYLRVSTPTVIDSMRFPNSKILIAKTKDTLNIKEENEEVTLFSGNKKIAHFTKTSLELFSEKGKVKKFDFDKKPVSINIFYILFGIFLFYSIVIYLYKKDLLKSLIQFCMLLIPLLFAHPFLSSGNLNNLHFIFDRKQLFLLSIFPIFKNISVSYDLLLFQVVPFILLLIAHYIFIILLSGRIYKIIFYIFLSIVILLFAHTRYFPLDKSTYVMIFSMFGLILCILFALSIIAFKITKSKKMLATFIVGIPFILLFLAGVTYFSRTKIILTPFETDALMIIRERGKDVIFVSETDYNIKPIYKAAKPMLYENYHLGEKLTDTHWQIVVRPENNILKVSDYDNKIIVVPRYLGADLSAQEMTLLKLRKIFDNNQIAIFEKR